MNEDHELAAGPGKKEWPELLRKLAVDARDAILQDNPNLKVFAMPAGSSVTEATCWNRVRIYVQDDGTVAAIPRIG
ncbi:subtilisin-chymotrypsin inhibitor-2B-like [Haliotis rubra]|uniref:subtilisin-chymotrypsin inhibitor-2B-like n=1 Tax=Haliotis rubra TaxID=36100 RepID=UPI001EE5574A|nr:subtilisin-chymotrypsin inhibitor-2B-like [Haliotis rubra]